MGKQRHSNLVAANPPDVDVRNCNEDSPITDGFVIVLLMGVSGAGKSTVGKRLASELAWPFHDADDLHTPENIARMRSGRPLDDEARLPWLHRVRDLIRALSRDRLDAVVACSALKETYRAILLDGVSDVRLVHLNAPAEVLRTRVREREGHFMPDTLVDSQVATLEAPVNALSVDASAPVQDVVRQILDGLGRR
jgi:gluconokinase